MRLARLPGPQGTHVCIGTRGGWLVRADHLDPSAPTDPLELLSLPGSRRSALEQQAEQLLADPDERRCLAARGVAGHVDEVVLAAPVSAPSKIIGVALNYRAHADEGGFVPPKRPVVFLKAPNSLCGHGEEVVVPELSRRLEHEGELAVVVGTRCKHLTADDWHTAVGGYTMMNDVTARDLQLEDLAQQHPWDLTKSFDTFGPTGPWLVSPDEVPDPGALDLELRVDGLVRQKSTTGAMIFGVGQLLVFLSSVMTLEAGDIIATGTCDGIGPVADGAVMEVQIGDLGVLRNPVRILADRRVATA